LPGGTEVVFLQEVDDGDAEGDGGSDVAASDANDECLGYEDSED